MAHKKAGGSSRNGRDSESKRLGVKKFGGESVLAGNIIVWGWGDAYGGDWAALFTAERNLWYRTDGKAPTFNGKSLAQWQSTGQDWGSRVANPQMTISDSYRSV